MTYILKYSLLKAKQLKKIEKLKFFSARIMRPTNSYIENYDTMNYALDRSFAAFREFLFKEYFGENHKEKYFKLVRNK